MTPLTTSTIETERLTLRPPVSADVPEWAAHIFADTDVMRYSPRRNHTPVARAERALNVTAHLWEQWAQGHAQGVGWMVRRKSDSQFIGSCEIDYIEDAKAGEIGFLVAKPFWGQGFEVEIVRAVIRFGFDHTTWERMVGDVIPANTDESRVFEDLGFIYEKDVNYYELIGNTSFALDDPMVAQYALPRERFAPGDAFYRLGGARTPPHRPQAR